RESGPATAALPSRRLRTRVPSTPPLSGVAEPLYRTDRTGALARGSIGRGPAGGTRSRPGAGAVGAGIIAGRRGLHRRRPVAARRRGEPVAHRGQPHIAAPPPSPRGQPGPRSGGTARVNHDAGADDGAVRGGRRPGAELTLLRTDDASSAAGAR